MKTVLFACDDPQHIPAGEDLIDRAGYRAIPVTLEPRAGSTYPIANEYVATYPEKKFDAVVIQEASNLGSSATSPGIELIRQLRGLTPDDVKFDFDDAKPNLDTPILMRGVREADIETYKAKGADWVQPSIQSMQRMADQEKDAGALDAVIEELRRRVPVEDSHRSSGSAKENPDDPGPGPQPEENHRIDVRGRRGLDRA